MAVITRWSYKRGGRKAGFHCNYNELNPHPGLVHNLDLLKIEEVVKFAKQFSRPGKSLEKTFGKMLKSLELSLLLLFCCFCCKATSN